MKRTGLGVALLAVLSMPVLAQQADVTALSAAARGQIKGFAGQLQATLKQGMESQGPVHAIGLCNTEAPHIAEAASQNGWQVGRTSLKVRNPANQPDDWERQVLQQFEQRARAGEDPLTLDASRLDDGEFRYMKAIPAAAVCLACHGSELSAPVAARLAELYPQDQARGYQLGDLRGAFTLRKTLE